MSHYSKIPKLLDALLATPSIAAACRAVAITEQCFYFWIIRAKRGDAPLQAIEWMGVVTDFATHYQNSKVLAAQAIEAGVLDQAMRGTWRETRFQGAPVYELSDDYAKLGFKDDDEARALGFNPEVDRYVWKDGKRVRVMEWSKPSDAMSTLVLQSWARKRYGAHVTTDINIGGVLRLGTTEQKPTEVPINIIGDDDNANPNDYSNRLALPQPAQSSAEMDAIAAATPDMATVVFQDATGRRTAVTQGPDPLLPKEGDRPYIVALKVLAAARIGKPASAPPPMVSGHHPDDDVADDRPELPRAPRPAPQASQGIGEGRMGYTRHPDLP
jgi:hypothetical protein